MNGIFIFLNKLLNYGINNRSECFSYEGWEAVVVMIAVGVQGKGLRGGGGVVLVANGSPDRSPSCPDSVATPSLYGETRPLGVRSVCITHPSRSQLFEYQGEEFSGQTWLRKLSNEHTHRSLENSGCKMIYAKTGSQKFLTMKKVFFANTVRQHSERNIMTSRITQGARNTK